MTRKHSKLKKTKKIKEKKNSKMTCDNYCSLLLVIKLFLKN